MEPIVMISGYARSGKDSLGAFLAQRHGFVVAKTSHALKHVAWELDPIVGFDPTAAGAVRLRDLITDPFDDDQTEAAKRSPYGEEVIRLWQRLGTDCVDHTALGADLWARALRAELLRRRAEGHRVAITDGRKPAEADLVRSLGGLVIRLDRPGVGPRNAHVNEVALDGYDFDLRLNNDGTLEQLAEHADGLAALLRQREVTRPERVAEPEPDGFLTF
ncbi:MAG: hypothetical protein R2715_10230 [Ilumatobacteraceae bacterium]